MSEFSKYPRFEEFKGKNILSVDYGEKAIGLASFCPGRDPFPLTRGKIKNAGFHNFLKSLKEVIDEDFFEILVFGIPYLTDGSESDKTLEMKKYFQIIRESCSDLLVFEQDETLSTFEAKKRMENSAEFNFKVDIKRIDEVSAIIILEDFIRSN